jgi:transcriptional regulator with GAF, ATPase, and Fis domain
MPMIARASDETANRAAGYIVASGTSRTGHHPFDARRAAADRDRTGIQHLIADLAGHFATIEPDAIDDAVVASLRQVCEGLRLDHVILWRTNGDGLNIVASHFGSQHPLRPLPDPRVLAAIPFIASRQREREAAFFTRLDEVTEEVDRSTILRQGVRSAAVVPVALSGGLSGERSALAFISTTTEHMWTPAVIEQLRLVAGVFGLALARGASHQALLCALGQAGQPCERPAVEELRRPNAGDRRTSCAIVSDGAAMRAALEQIELVAPTPATVLLLGETGTGKEVLARAIHDLSPRRLRPMIRVNCGAIPAALIESELFGRERGAYTGAITRQIGRFEAAHQSTLFLDEIGELPVEIQVKLLRVLQERVIERLGSPQPIKVDVRIIAATNRRLEEAVENKSFREDLFYRLNVFPCTVPPLRQRIEDLPGLVWTFIDEFSKSFGKPIESIASDSMRQMQAYSWPGNVRELRNLIERAVILATGPRLTVQMPQPGTSPEVQNPTALASLVHDHIRATLESTGWRIRGAGGAAERLGLKPTTLESRMARLGLVQPPR